MITCRHSWLVLAVFANAMKAQYLPVARDEFKLEKIIPDVLDDVPTYIANVNYGGSQVYMGNVLAPSDVKNPPSVSFPADPDKFYTLVLVDPDAPSPENPIYRSWLHWQVVNIPGSSVSHGETLTDYVGPTPPKNTGLHRYVFVIFEQPRGRITFDEPKVGTRRTSAADRGKFSVRNFGTKYSLGYPLAGNFFKAQWQ